MKLNCCQQQFILKNLTHNQCLKNKKDDCFCSLLEVEKFLCCVQDSCTILKICDFIKNFNC